MSKVDPNMNGGTTLARKVTAVGTMGSANQLFTVYEANWHCADCGQENYAARPKCFRCRKSKPAGLNNYVMDPALQALQQGKVIPWQEVVDPTTYQIYYHNKETNETQWERPAEMGPAPVATGWFGRGKAGSNAAQLYAERNKNYLTRLARKQKEFIDPKKYHLEGANEFNIWYGRYIGDMANKNDTEPASDRCVVETDAGATKADLVVDEKKRRKYFCLHFAHGACAKGPECTFYHRIPLPQDDAQIDELFDCFGRQRHSKHRDDMNGTGSFLKPCRTLFVGNLLKQKYDTPKALEDALWRHFGEWGEVESINVIHRLSIAFPRYRLRTSAEFAKEAMVGQSLDKGEILMIRWAHDDPNPVAQDSIDRADKDALVGLMAAKGISLTPASFEYPADYQLPDAKRPRLTDGSVDPSVFQQYPELAYPNTDGQFVTNTVTPAAAGTGDASAVNSATASTVQIPGPDGKPKTVDIASQEYAEYYADYCAKYYAQQEVLTRFGVDVAAMEAEQAKVSGSSSSSSNAVPESKDGGAEDKEQTEEEEEEEEEWTKHTDESTGASYYFNNVTGESSWVDPRAEK